MKNSPLQQLPKYIPRLIHILHNTPPQQHLLKLSPIALQQQGIKIPVLDFDGVLAAHGETSPHPQALTWLNQAVTVFGATHIFILSNQASPNRIAFFAKHYPNITFLTGVRKKPHPDGLETVMKITGQPPHALILIDDRLLTGGLAACIADTQFAYILAPYQSFAKRPFSETLFAGLRFLERQGIQLYAKLYQKFIHSA